MMKLSVQDIILYLVVGLIALVAIVAFAPTIFDEWGKLGGTVSGVCRVTSVPAASPAGSPPVGTEWQVGQYWFDGRYTTGLPTGANTGGKCEVGTVGAVIPVPTDYPVYYYIPTSVSQSPYATLMTTIIRFGPVLVIVGLFFWALKKMGILNLNTTIGGGTPGGGKGGGNDAN